MIGEAVGLICDRKGGLKAYTMACLSNVFSEGAALLMDQLASGVFRICLRRKIIPHLPAAHVATLLAGAYRTLATAPRGNRDILLRQ